MGRSLLSALLGLVVSVVAFSGSSNGHRTPRVLSAFESTNEFTQTADVFFVSNTRPDSSVTVIAAGINLGSPKYGGKFYGNWCGPDWSGGVTNKIGDAIPVDDLDLLCRHHDSGYAGADSYWGPIYRKAKTTADRKKACNSWLWVYRQTDVAMTSAVRNLPSLVGTIHPTRPDAWKYDPTIFGVHPRTVAQRQAYKVSAVITGNLGLFKTPPCSTR